jgi:hypothetical protein
MRRRSRSNASQARLVFAFDTAVAVVVLLGVSGLRFGVDDRSHGVNSDPSPYRLVRVSLS